MEQTTPRPNFDRLRDAFAILDGIPKKAWRLEAWRSRGSAPVCGTIACAAGWLAMNPTMNEQGLTGGVGAYPLCGGMSGYGALRKFFNLDTTTGDVFCPRGYGYKDRELTKTQLQALSDKQLWQRRTLRLFQDFNEPFNQALASGLNLNARNGQ